MRGCEIKEGRLESIVSPDEEGENADEDRARPHHRQHDRQRRTPT
jgi:hypothetical protein